MRTSVRMVSTKTLTYQKINHISKEWCVNVHDVIRMSSVLY